MSSDWSVNLVGIFGNELPMRKIEVMLEDRLGADFDFDDCVEIGGQDAYLCKVRAGEVSETGRVKLPHAAWIIVMDLPIDGGYWDGADGNLPFPELVKLEGALQDWARETVKDSGVSFHTEVTLRCM